MAQFDLSGLNAIVTGATRGLGFGVASRLAQAGARVGVHGRTAEAAQEAVSELGGGARLVPLHGDMAEPDDIEAMFRAADAELGRPDILVNNAGVVVTHDAFETSLEEWEQVLNVNLRGAWLCSKAALQRLGDGRGGRIIMMGSVVAHRGAVKGWPAYGASKAGLHGLAKTLSRTAGRLDVTVNIVAPGVIVTEMVQGAHGDTAQVFASEASLGRLGTVDDVAAAVHYLASREAGYVTGACLDVNGGLYLRA